MKRLAALLSALIFLFTSCSVDVRAEDVLAQFCREYPIDAEIYSSLREENGSGYMDAEMLTALFGIAERPSDDFAIVFFGKVDKVREVGVFVIENGEDVIEISELLARRISFLSTFSEGEGFIKKYRGAIAYGFVEDSAYAERIFDSIL